MNDKIIKICEQKFIYLNYSFRTKEIYIHYITQFLKTIENKQIIHCNSNVFQNYLDNYKFTSISQQNQVINAIRFLYKYGLEKKYDKVSFQRPRKEKSLPRVIDKDHILNNCNNISNKKHKSIILLAYSVGLRVSEIINLKIVDIDSKRMIININQAKGKKDRIVPLTTAILQLLREYYKEYKPKEYLFNGQNNSKYSSTSCNKIVKKYLGEDYHFHLLRHSCFTNLTEQNVDIRTIQKLAGHSSTKTTEIYTHVSKNRLQSLPLAI
jgi:site-specific recombinase XerD